MWYLLADTIPGIDMALNSAQTRGYEAIMLVIVMIVMIGSFIWVMRWQFNQSSEREKALSTKVDNLQEFIRDQLITALRENTQTMGRMLAAAEAIIVASNTMMHTMERFTSILDVRPCLLPAAEQRRLLAEIEEAYKQKEQKHPSK